MKRHHCLYKTWGEMPFENITLTDYINIKYALYEYKCKRDHIQPLQIEDWLKEDAIENVNN